MKKKAKLIEIFIRKSKQPTYQVMLRELKKVSPKANLIELKEIITHIRMNYINKKETLVHDGKKFLFTKRGSGVHAQWINKMKKSVNTHNELINMCR